MSYSRLSAYKTMWVMVFFDLPTADKKQRRQYSIFRKKLLSDGFTMFQLSIYLRPCASVENANVHIKRVSGFLPDEGTVCIMMITDKQFSNIKVFDGPRKLPPKAEAIQLEIF